MNYFACWPDSRRNGVTLAVLVLAVCLPGGAFAFQQTYSLGNVDVAVYAPDWTWQKRDINILIVARNEGTQTEQISAALTLPEGKENDFSFAGEPVCTLVAAPKGIARAAFAGIAAKDGVPKQTYHFSIRLHAGNGDAVADYPVKTIRGAVVNSGNWALYLPAGVALAWCLAFAIALRRMAGPGAWRRAAEAIEPSADRPAWIDGSVEHWAAGDRETGK